MISGRQSDARGDRRTPRTSQGLNVRYKKILAVTAARGGRRGDVSGNVSQKIMAVGINESRGSVN